MLIRPLVEVTADLATMTGRNRPMHVIERPQSANNGLFATVAGV